MAAKLLHSLADDNPDLQKQIGCMTGILQIFDRQQFVAGRRPNQRRLLPPPPGNSKFGNGGLDDSSNLFNREAEEKNPNKYVNEKQRASTESSRASFSSSSRSSSFSSLDCGRPGQPEPSSLDRIIFPETPSRDPGITQMGASPKMGRLSFDLRDVVKDSMYRDSRGLTVQTVVKEDRVPDHGAKSKDSPRPMQLPKSADGPSDIKESLKVLAKLRDAPWYYSLESKEEGPSLSVPPKDPPRFSYDDGRDMNRRIKDLPRLSLDNRERVPHLLQPPSRGSTSVVAKLMGLDTLPEAKTSSHENRLGPIRTFVVEDRVPSLRAVESCRPVRLPKSPKSSRKDPTSPRWRNNGDGVMRPVSSSKFPIEPAPWKHMDGGRVSPKQAYRPVKSSTTTSTSSTTSPSVYGEIEKRLKDIEFKQSGKDLRALKQILEAMQAKGFLEDETKEQKNVNLVTNRVDDHHQRLGSELNARAKARGSSPSKGAESPIVIMKPAKLVQNGEVSTPPRKNTASSRSAAKDKDQANTPTDRRPNRSSRASGSSSSRSPQVTKDNNTTAATTTTTTSSSSVKNSGSISPRLQQKKMEFDRRSRPPTPPSSDASKTRRQPNRQSSDQSSSPGGRRRPKPSESSAKNSESGNLSSQEATVSATSDVKVTLEPIAEITSTGSDACQSPAMEALKCSLPQETNGMSLRLTEENAPGCRSIALEQPSPVSVLDSSPYIEDSLSPVKQTSYALQDKDDATAESNGNLGDLWDTADSPPTETTLLELPSEISRKKLQSIDNLVQKLRRLNSTHDETQTDYIASLCENTNPDHRYISEILLASGLLLRDLGSGLTGFQLHPSGHPINPELFFVLEQTKASKGQDIRNPDEDEITLTKTTKLEKSHRKLLFDTVNEILTGKLGLAGPPAEPWIRPEKLARKTLNAQKLLRELCAEIELLEAGKKQEFALVEEEEEDVLKPVLWEDVMHRSGKWNWDEFKGEFSGIVLDVERHIFKELVDEIVIGEAAGKLRAKPSNRRCRQLLFSSDSNSK